MYVNWKPLLKVYIDYKGILKKISDTMMIEFDYVNS